MSSGMFGSAKVWPVAVILNAAMPVVSGADSTKAAAATDLSPNIHANIPHSAAFHASFPPLSACLLPEYIHSPRLGLYPSLLLVIFLLWLMRQLKLFSTCEMSYDIVNYLCYIYVPLMTVIWTRMPWISLSNLLIYYTWCSMTWHFWDLLYISMLIWFRYNLYFCQT